MAAKQDTNSSAAAARPYRLEIKTVQAPVFKTLIEAMKELLTDTSIEFDETGMKIKAVDTLGVVMVRLKLDASKFEVYHCEGRISIGVNMLQFHKLLKTINNNNTLSLFIDRDDVNHLGIRIENSEKNTRTVYKLNLMDMDHHDLNADPLVFPEVTTVSSADFQKICRDMNNLADYMEIRCVHDQLIFSCKGEFCSQETVICDGQKQALQALQQQQHQQQPLPDTADIVQGVFSIKHLVLFTKCTNLSPTMDIYLANDFPLIVKYEVSSLGSIHIALAPHTQQHTLGGWRGNWQP
jgi:proliferating cell nuclear antigen